MIRHFFQRNNIIPLSIVISCHFHHRQGSIINVYLSRHLGKQARKVSLPTPKVKNTSLTAKWKCQLEIVKIVASYTLKQSFISGAFLPKNLPGQAFIFFCRIRTNIHVIVLPKYSFQEYEKRLYIMFDNTR